VLMAIHTQPRRRRFRELFASRLACGQNLSVLG
jgi:hypothetical protein